MKKKLQKIPFFLFLSPIFIILHIEKEYHQLISYQFVYTEILMLFLMPLIFYSICRLLFRSHQKASLYSFFLLIPFYLLGEIKDWLKDNLQETFWQSYSFIIPFIIVLAIAAFLLLRRTKIGFEKIFLYINTALIIFILSDSILILISDFKKKDDNKSNTRPLSIDCPTCEKPDIYYLIFDSYTSGSVLKEFGYNNSIIESYLIKKGFYIIDSSRSNYNLTPFSIGSSLNMDYIPGVTGSNKHYLKDYLPAAHQVYTNNFTNLLSGNDYAIFNHSIFDIKSTPTTVKRFDIWQINSLYRQHNIFKKVFDDIGWKFPLWLRALFQNQKITYAKERDEYDSTALSHIFHSIQTTTTKPKFVYGHLLIPHSPYTFDSSGKKIVPKNFLTQVEDKKAYCQQIQHVNKVITQVIDMLFTSQKRPFAVIIQGDHGYRFFDEKEYNKEFRNFSAVYFSNQDYSHLNDSLTNVNTFRILLNTYFKQDLPVLNDHYYFLKYE